MELIVKVNVKTIESGKNKFDVYNTYVKDEKTGEWVKFNVKFKQGVTKPACDSYLYVDEGELSINEIGKYPTLFINKVNSVTPLRFDNKNLAKYFKTTVEEAHEILGVKEGETIFDEKEVDPKDLPFDTDDDN